MNLLFKGCCRAEHAAGRWMTWAVLAAVCALVIWVQRPLLDTDFCYQSDVFGITYNADVISRGGIPYRDTAEYKMPGCFFLYAWIFEAWGRSLAGVWAVSLAAQILMLMMVYVTGYLIAGRITGLGAALIYTVTAFNYDLGGIFNINYSFWMTVPYTGAMLFFLQSVKNNRLSDWFLCGLLLGLALLFKRPALAGIAAVFFYLMMFREKNWPVRAGMVVGGAAAAWVPLLIYYGVHGALPALAEGIWGGPWGWAGQRYFFAGWFRASSMIRNIHLSHIAYGVMLLTTLLMVPVVCLRLQGDGSPKLGRILIALGIWTFMAHAYLLAGRFYEHYFVQGLGATSVLMAYSLQLLPACNILIRRLWSAGIAVSLGVLLFVAIWSFSSFSANLINMRFFLDPVLRAGAYIKEQSRTGDSIYALGKLMDIYYYAQRPAFTRMFRDRSYILDIDLDYFYKAHFSDQAGIRERFYTDFVKAPPRFLAVKRQGDSSVDMTEWPELTDAVSKNYLRKISFVNILMRVDIYERKPGVPGSGYPRIQDSGLDAPENPL